MSSKRRAVARKPIGASIPANPASPKLKSVEKPKASSDVRGVAELMRVLEEGDTAVRDVLEAECDLILECRICKSLFRNVQNFSNHKRNYCTEKASQGKGMKRRVSAQSVIPSTSPKSKARRMVGNKKAVTDELTRELEEAMLDMGEGGEEERRAASSKRRSESTEEGAGDIDEYEAIGVDDAADVTGDGSANGDQEMSPVPVSKKRPSVNVRPWSTPQPSVSGAASSRPLKKFLGGASEPKIKRPALAKVEPVNEGSNKCRHCGKIFMNRAGCVSHERYCANLTMKPLLGRGLAFADEFNTDIPTPTGDDLSSSMGIVNAGTPGKGMGVFKKVSEFHSAAGGSDQAPGVKQVLALPKGALLRRSDGGEGGVQQTYIVTTINGIQRAIPVKPAAGPPPAAGSAAGRAYVKVAVPVGTKPGSQVVRMSAGAASAAVAGAAKPAATGGTPKAAEPPKPTTPEAAKTPAQAPQGPQAPIPNNLQPDLVKLLKEFSNISGTVFFTMSELIKLNKDPASGSRLKELIAALPPAGLIASKPISSGVLTKIVLSRPSDGEEGALKVVVIESGYSSQMRMRSKRDSEPASKLAVSALAHADQGNDDQDEDAAGVEEEVEENEDVKEAVSKLFDENGPNVEEDEEEEAEEVKIKKAKLLLPPPKPVLRKMKLKMNKLLESAVSKQVTKKKQAKEEDADANDDATTSSADGDAAGADAFKEKMKKDENDVTFKEMFAMPEGGEEAAEPEDYYTKAAMILAPDEGKGESDNSEKNVRRSAFSRKK